MATMLRVTLVVGGTLLSVASGAQPSAPAPVAAPMRDLPWGDLNFLATTDTHGWHAGHLQEPQYSADWGDYISFASRLKEKADHDGVDLLLVDTGDRVDGNGLYDGSDPKGKYTYDIFKEQDIDILCTGNHELYEAATADREWSQTIPNFKGNYLASNVDIIDPKTGNRTALAQRYRKFTTKNRGIKVLAFGFLFDFTGNANNTFVQPVEDTIKEDWFHDAIREKVDIFVVVGHVTLRSEEYKIIFKAIRDQNWDTPIQFFGGHSHIRDYTSYDSNAYALQSGRYMETIGWMSIDNIGSNPTVELDDDKKKPSPKFARRYIDNNLFGYHYHTGLNDTSFPTERGQNVSTFIKNARGTMHLDKTYGCAPQDLWLNRAEYPSNGSMFTWLEKQVLPSVLVQKDRADIPKLAIINTGAVRFDIFKGAYTRDTIYIVCPFRNQFRMIRDVPYAAASKILNLLNTGGPVLDAVAEEHRLQSWLLTPPEQISVSHDTVVLDDSRKSGHDNAQVPLVQSNKPSLIPGYTTKDDFGSDGDDTLHDPISFYRVPNCIESKIVFPSEGDPERVDLIFLDFVQPWILIALRFLGQGYEIKDTEPYKEGETFTHLMKDWIAENWEHEC